MPRLGPGGRWFKSNRPDLQNDKHKERLEGYLAPAGLAEIAGQEHQTLTALLECRRSEPGIE